MAIEKSETTLEATLKRDRMIVAVALTIIAALAWIYTWRLVTGMTMGTMGGMDMSPEEMAAMVPLPLAMQHPWTIPDVGFVLTMWMVMMIGMMTPSVTPMILLYARVGRQALAQGHPFAATGWFATGYLLAWCAFSVVASFAQWLLERAALLTPMMSGTGNIFGGIVLIAVGAYQWTPLKYTCLSQCQAPLTFIQRHGGFSPRWTGSLWLGARHGAYCVGCCWALMALLFVGGVMNVRWIAAIAIMVLLEKILPAGRVIARFIGLIFLLAGIWLIATSLEPALH